MNERIKAKRISSELMDFFLRNNFTKLTLALDVCENKTLISIVGDVKPACAKLDYLREELNKPRLPEYDDFYDELLGTDQEKSLELVAFMTDSAEVECSHGKIRITLIREHV